MKLSGLPHVSVSYLYNMLNPLVNEFFEKWILDVNVTSVEDFAKVRQLRSQYMNFFHVFMTEVSVFCIISVVSV